MNLSIQDLNLDNLLVAVSPGVLSQNLDQETILLNVESGEYYGLDEIGSRIWSLLQQGRSVKEVLTSLLDEYEVSEECLRNDVRQFLAALQDKGLVEVHDSSTA